MTQRAITVLLQAVTGPYQAAMGRAAAATQGFGTTARNAGRSVADAQAPIGGMTAKLVGGGALLGAVGSVASELMDYETALVGVGKTSGLAGAELAALGDDLTDVAQTMDGSAEDMLRIGQIAAQLGAGTADEIAAFTETIAGIATATDLTAEAAATDMARLGNIMQIPLDDVEGLGSVLVGLGNTMATNESEILSLGTRLAAAGTNAGMTGGEVLGLAAAMSALGVEAEAGGTAASMALNDITAAVVGNTDDLEGFATIAGMTADEFAVAWGEDAAGAFNTFIVGLQQIDEAGGSVTTALDAVGISGARQQDAFLRLAGNTELVNFAFDSQSTLLAENVALADEVAAATGTAAVAFDNLKDSISELLRAAGDDENGTGALTQSIEAATWAVQRFSDVVSGTDLSDLSIGTPFGMLREGVEDLVNLVPGAELALPSLAESWREVTDAFRDDPVAPTFADTGEAAADAYVSMLEARNAAGQAAGGLDDLADSADDATGELVSLEEAVSEYVAAQRAASDPMLAAIRAGHDLAEALAAAEAGAKELDKGLITQDEYDALILDAAEASRDLELALFEAGASGADAEAEFREMAASAGLSTEATDRLLAIVRETGQAADHEFRDRSMEIDTEIDMSAFTTLERRLSDIFGRPYRVNVTSTYTPSPTVERQAIDDAVRRSGVPTSTSAISRRASGGPVQADTPYLVGEAGPELFFPGQYGTVVDTQTSAVMMGASPAPAAAPPPDKVVHVTSNVYGQVDGATQQQARLATRRLYASVAQ